MVKVLIGLDKEEIGLLQESLVLACMELSTEAHMCDMNGSHETADECRQRRNKMEALSVNIKLACKGVWRD
jgi:hypothetical protein